jgi:anti-anti-sigma factor
MPTDSGLGGVEWVIVVALGLAVIVIIIAISMWGMTAVGDQLGDPEITIEPGPMAGSYLLDGELDTASAGPLATLTPPPAAVDVLLDMSRVTFLDSGGIRAIVALASRIDRYVVITRPSDPVRTVLDVVGLNKLPGILVRE